MKIEQLLREFRYNGVVLADPNQAFTLSQVRDFYSTTYPQIVSADIEGPEQVGAKAIYTFRRAVGTKGAREWTVDNQRQRIDALATLLQERALSADEGTLVKNAQILVHAGRIDELSPLEVVQLKRLHQQHCLPRVA
jgi:PRTRC genetic system protein C